MATIMNQLLEEQQYVLECVQGMDEHDQPVYAYLLLKKTQLDAFKKAIASGDVDLAEHGQIVAHGNDAEPPEGLDDQVIAALRSDFTA